MLRTLIGIVSAFYLLSGVYMLIAPTHWYEAVPGVTSTGPFNIHFVRDIGLVFIASAGALLWGVVRDVRPVAMAGAAWPCLHGPVPRTDLARARSSGGYRGCGQSGSNPTAGMAGPVGGVEAAAPSIGDQAGNTSRFTRPPPSMERKRNYDRTCMHKVVDTTPGSERKDGTMLKWILHTMTRKFERAYDYDGTYMHEIVDLSAGAGLRLSALPFMSGYRDGAPAELWAGAALASSLDGDCGPCAQLTVDFALEAGVRPAALRACLAGEYEEAGLAGLGFRFARAAIADDPETEVLRSQIVQRFGRRALVAVAFATATSRAYPVLKRAMGHGAACQRLDFGEGPSVAVRQAA